MSARDTGGAKQGCSLALHYEMKCEEKNTVSWCDNQENRNGVGGVFTFFKKKKNFLNAINSSQLRKWSFTAYELAGQSVLQGAEYC